jgi:hypothetical protein
MMVQNVNWQMIVNMSQSLASYGRNTRGVDVADRKSESRIFSSGTSMTRGVDVTCLPYSIH